MLSGQASALDTNELATAGMAPHSTRGRQYIVTTTVNVRRKAHADADIEKGNHCVPKKRFSN